MIRKKYLLLFVVSFTILFVDIKVLTMSGQPKLRCPKLT